MFCTARFVLDLGRNPEDRVSPDVAHIVLLNYREYLEAIETKGICRRQQIPKGGMHKPVCVHLPLHRISHDVYKISQTNIAGAS